MNDDTPAKAWPRANGEMGGRIRTHDWTRTPLGPVEQWPDGLRTLVDLILALPAPASILWGRTGIRIFNDAYLGIDPRATQLGRPLDTTPVGGPAGATMDAFEAAFHGRATQFADIAFPRHDAGVCIDAPAFDITFSPIRLEDGEVGGVLQLLVDVTDRRRAQKSLSESETRHRLLIDTGAQAVWETDAAGLVVEDSPSWRSYTGQTLEEWVGYGWLDAIHPDDRAHAERQWRQATAACGRVDAEFRLRAPDGGWRWTNVRAAPVFDASGRVEKWVAMNIDIDARKHAQAALAKSESEFRTLFDSIDEGLAIVEMVYDERGEIVDLVYRQVNAAYERHGGVHDVVGRSIFEVIPGVEDAWLDRYRRVAKTGESIRVEDFQRDVNRWFDVYFARVDEEGRFVAIVFNDITERKLAEHGLRQSDERHAFLLELSDGVRSLADPADIQGETTSLLRNQLDAGWCYYVDWDLDRKAGAVLRDSTRGALPSLAGLHDVADADEFLGLLGTGEVLAVRDYAAFEALPPDTREKFVGLGFRSMMAAPLVKQGRLIATLIVGDTRVREWSANEAAFLAEAAERTWAAVERARSEAALRASESRLQFALKAAELAVYEWDPASDAVLLNRRFRELVGVPADAPPTSAHLFDNAVHPADRAWVVAEIGRAMKGESDGKFVLEHRLARPCENGTAWVISHGEVYFEAGEGARRPVRVFGTLQDITKRKHAEEALRQSEERKAFLLTLGDAMRGESRTEELIEVAARLLGERLRASRVLFAEFDEAAGLAHVFSGWSVDGASPFPKVMRLADYEGPVLDDLRAGRTVRVDDTSDRALARPELMAISRIGVGALLSIPLHLAGRLAVNISIHQFDARSWTDDDVAITHEAAVRIWAEVVRARAEAASRDSDARRLAMADAAPVLVWETDAQGATYVNRHYLDFFGVPFEAVAGMGWAKFVHPDDLEAYSEVYLRASRDREPFEYDVRLRRADGAYRWMRTTGRPLGALCYVGACLDITDEREVALHLEAERERQAFLLQLSDTLRAEPTVEAIGHRAIAHLSDHLGLDRCYVTFYRPELDEAVVPYQVGNESVPPLPARIRLSDFPEAYAHIRGQTLVIEDDLERQGLSATERANSAGLGMRAMVASTIRGGEKNPLASLAVVSSRPRRWSPAEVALVEEAAERTWAAMERARAEAGLSESAERLRLGAEVARFALWDWNLRTGAVDWSDEHFRMQGYAVGEVVPSYEAWAARVHPDDLPGTEAAIANARDRHTDFVREFRCLHPDGSVHWLSARGRFFYDDAGQPVRMIGAMLETTERRQWEEHQKVLVAELQHRTFNLMGIVRSTADATIRTSTDLADFKQKFRDRIGVLARVQRLLSKLDERRRITFDQLVRGELESVGAFDAGERVALDGPGGVSLRSGTVQTLAMGLHELATNAVKYGAIRQPGASLAVTWKLDTDNDGVRWLNVDWRESGVAMPQSERPQGTGQGRELIERALPYQLKARTTYTLGPGGVHCTISVPLASSKGRDGDNV